jgi:O-antigen/teichoic acid export membrane protein
LDDNAKFFQLVLILSEKTNQLRDLLTMDVPKKNIKAVVIKSFLWNSGGTFIYSISKWLLTILVIRISGNYSDVGYLALAMSVTNIFVVVAAYGMRNYQVSDVKGEFSTSVYVTSRLVTVSVTFILCLACLVFFFGFDYRSLIVSIYMLLVSAEAFSDVLHGIEQKKWRMDLIGLSMFIRGAVFIIVFTFLYRFYGLSIAILGIFLLSLLVVIFLDLRLSRRLSHFSLDFEWTSIIILLKKCFPLALVGVLFMLPASMARIYLENTTDTTTLGIFSSATTPAIVVSQVAVLVFTPLVNVFSRSYADGDFRGFNTIFLYVYGGLVALSTIAIIVAVFIGAEALTLFFGESIRPYSYLLIEAMVVAGFIGLKWFLVTILTVMRKIKAVLICSAIGFITCTVSARWLLGSFSMSGANYVQILGFGISVIMMTLAYVIYQGLLRSEWKKTRKEH